MYKFLLLLLVLPKLAFAIDIVEVYQLARANDPILKSAEASKNADREPYRQAIANLLPGANAVADTNSVETGTSDSFNTHSVGVTISQPIIRFDLWTQVAQNKQLKTAAEFRYQQAEEDLILRVAQQYFSILRAHDELHFNKGRLRSFKRQRDEANEKFKVGLIPVTDVEEAKALSDQAQADVIRADNMLHDEYQILNEIIGQQIFGLAGLNGFKAESPEPNDIEAWVSQALEHNPDLNSAKAISAAAKHGVHRAYAQHLPTIDLSASAARSKTARPARDYLTRKSASLNFTMPLFQGGGILSATREACHLYQASNYDRIRVQRNTESETRQAFRGVETAISRVKALEQSVKSSERALETIRESYKVGLRTIVDVLAAETLVLQSKRDLNSEKYEFLLEGLRLKALAGILTGADLDGINLFLLG